MRIYILMRKERKRLCIQYVFMERNRGSWIMRYMTRMLGVSETKYCSYIKGKISPKQYKILMPIINERLVGLSLQQHFWSESDSAGDNPVQHTISTQREVRHMREYVFILKSNRGNQYTTLSCCNVEMIGVKIIMLI